MKSYYDFILENESVLTGSTQNISVSTGSTINQVDIANYNNIKNSLHDFWKTIITNRNLNFIKDTDEALISKRKNTKYKKYWSEIDKIIQKRETDKKNIENINLQQSKIKDAVSALINLKFPVKNVKEVVNSIIIAQPDITIENLVKLSIQKLSKK